MSFTIASLPAASLVNHVGDHFFADAALAGNDTLASEGAIAVIRSSDLLHHLLLKTGASASPLAPGAASNVVPFGVSSIVSRRKRLFFQRFSPG